MRGRCEARQAGNRCLNYATMKEPRGWHVYCAGHHAFDTSGSSDGHGASQGADSSLGRKTVADGDPGCEGPMWAAATIASSEEIAGRLLRRAAYFEEAVYDWLVSRKYSPREVDLIMAQLNNEAVVRLDRRGA